MNAPDRTKQVAEILSTLPVFPKTEQDIGRRANLYTIVRRLNAIEPSPEWGVLTKTDQGGKIPGDIIVWRSTLEHFDVITGDGKPYWKADGIVPSTKWSWTPVDGAPLPAPPTDPTLTEIADRLTLVEGELVALRHLLQRLGDVQALGLGGTIRFLGRDYPVLLLPATPKNRGGGE